MATPARERDQEEERRERDRYLLLRHALTLSDGDPQEVLMAERVWRDLGFPRSEALPLVESLILAEYLVDRGTGPQVSLTCRAVEYLERHAGRRRSVRLLR